ncbi:MAG: sodium:proton antiporter, partial [Pseudomonadales bacterium]|nr:sodium:proton antiporter [Pseudomonadales bacterium]
MYTQLALLALFAFAFSLISGRLERTVVSSPMVYITFGFLVGPTVLGWLATDVTDREVRALCDFTLALVLFSDAARA